MNAGEVKVIDIGKYWKVSVRFLLYLRAQKFHQGLFFFFLLASVSKALNVLQPYWLIVLPLDVPDLTASLLL